MVQFEHFLSAVSGSSHRPARSSGSGLKAAAARISKPRSLILSRPQHQPSPQFPGRKGKQAQHHAHQARQGQRVGEEAKPLLPLQREERGEVGAQQRFVEAHQPTQTELIELMAQHQFDRPKRLPTPLRQSR